MFKMTLKRYKVYVYNKIYYTRDYYEVNAKDLVDAIGIAVQRLIDKTSHGLDEWEITEVKRIKED